MKESKITQAVNDRAKTQAQQSDFMLLTTGQVITLANR